MDLFQSNGFYIQTLVLLITILLSSLIVIYYSMPRLLFTLIVRIVLLCSPFRRRKYIQVDKDISACYMERGFKKENIPSIVLLHAFCSAGTEFGKVAALFNKEYHVIALDMLNHGGTTVMNKTVTMSDMTSFIGKFVETMGLSRIHIMGFSTGGAVAASFASRFPERVESLIIGCPPGIHTVKPEKLLSEYSIEEIKDFFRMFCNGQLKVPEFFFTAWLDHIKANYWKYHYVYQGILDGPQEFKFTPEFMKNLKPNTLVVWGDFDQLCLTKGAEYLKEHIPKSTVILIENCGHMIWETHAKQLSDVINEWISADDKH